MTLSNLTPDEASAVAVRTLGLDPQVLDLTSPEGLAASLRRAASFMCPTSPSRLIDAVLDTIRPLIEGQQLSREEVAGLLDLLIASGDLLELRQDQEGRYVRLVYLGPPSYIERAPGNYVLLGTRPFGAWLVDAELAEHVESEGHTRTLFLDAAQADDRLKMAGLRRIDPDRWVASPGEEPAADLTDRLARRLDVAHTAGEIEDLQILDPVARVRFYRGRWRSPKPGDSGDFVARRPQAYGADLWSLVRLEDGSSTKLLDLPIDDPLVPARDEAWRAQMAIDAVRGYPQQFATEPGADGDETVVRFFSPIPGFAERYLQLVGMALGSTPGALFAFKVPSGAMSGVERLLTDMLWLKPVSKEGQ
jgi:hypothetical protein